MSELSDKIALFQKKTGESVLVSKKYIELASGDLEVALAIYLEDNSKEDSKPANKVDPKPAPQPTSAETELKQIKAEQDKNAQSVKKMLQVNKVAAIVGTLVFGIAVIVLIICAITLKYSYLWIFVGMFAVGTIALLYTAIVSDRRMKLMLKFEKEYNLSPYDALRVLIRHKWKVEAAEEEIKRK